MWTEGGWGCAAAELLYVAGSLSRCVGALYTPCCRGLARGCPEWSSLVHVPGLVLSDGEQQVRDILAACDSSGLMTDYELDSMAQCSYGQLDSMCTAGSDYGSWDYSYGAYGSDVQCSWLACCYCLEP